MVSCSTCTQIGTNAAYPNFTAHTQTHGQAAEGVMNCAGDREETAGSSNHVDDGLQKFHVWSRSEPHQLIYEVCWSTVAMLAGEERFASHKIVTCAGGPETILRLCGPQDSDVETLREARVQRLLSCCCHTQCAMNCQMWLKSHEHARDARSGSTPNII